MPSWLKDAVFYEIYPNSFMDTNGDGYGDFKGITQKLDYVRDLGCNAIWINPCFDSPFMDGGYDVRDFFKVSERFGTMEDFDKLLARAKALGIKIILDLVAGHTSEQCEMFLKSAEPVKNEFTDRFVWTKNPWESPEAYRFISGRHQRHGNYMVNFFSTQPALNYGFYEITHPEWQMPHTHPECLKTREWLKSVIRFWLDKGVAGFRVDMADSLVKNDHEKIATAEIWRDIRAMLDKDYPEAVLISEWSSPRAVNAGFHVDFILDHWGNPYNRLCRYEEAGADKHSVFDKQGRGDPKAFFEGFAEWHDKIKDKGYAGIITCNHDTPRLSRSYDQHQLKLIYATLMFLPGVPFIYYGDEIGQKYQGDLVSVECGFARTGSRTPMQWESGKNMGFSDCEPQKLFLPVDNAVNVKDQLKDSNSLLNTTKQLIALRQGSEDLKSTKLEAVYIKQNEFPIVFKRGSFIVALNPTDAQRTAQVNIDAKPVFNIGAAAKQDGNTLVCPPLSITLFKK